MKLAVVEFFEFLFEFGVHFLPLLVLLPVLFDHTFLVLLILLCMFLQLLKIERLMLSLDFLQLPLAFFLERLQNVLNEVLLHLLVFALTVIVKLLEE